MPREAVDRWSHDLLRPGRVGKGARDSERHDRVFRKERLKDTLVVRKEPLAYEESAYLGAVMNSERISTLVLFLHEHPCASVGDFQDFVGKRVGDSLVLSDSQVNYAYDKLLHFSLAVVDQPQHGAEPRRVSLNTYGDEVAALHAGYSLDFAAKFKPPLLNIWGKGAILADQKAEDSEDLAGHLPFVYQRYATEMRVRMFDRLVQAANSKTLPVYFSDFSDLSFVHEETIRKTIMQLSENNLVSYIPPRHAYWLSEDRPDVPPRPLPEKRSITEYVDKYMLSYPDTLLTPDECVIFVRQRFPQTLFLDIADFRERLSQIMAAFAQQGYLREDNEPAVGLTAAQYNLLGEFVRNLRMVQWRNPEGFKLGKAVLDDPQKLRKVLSKVPYQSRAKPEEQRAA